METDKKEGAGLATRIKTSVHAMDAKKIRGMFVAGFVMLSASSTVAYGAVESVSSSLGWLDSIKNLGPTTAVLILLFISNIIILSRMRKDAKNSSKRDLVLSELNGLNTKITLFYNPMHAMLSMNEDMARKFGPESWAQEKPAREEGMLLWNEIKNSIVWENNKKILKLLVEYTHFIEDEKEVEAYKKLRAHLISYFASVERKIELRKRHDFPGDVNYVVKNARDLVLRRRDRVQSELGRYFKGE